MSRIAVSRLAVSRLSLLPSSARRRSLIEKVVHRVFEAEKARLTGELNVVFLDRKKMLAMNERFLAHSHDTDVLSFRYDEGDEAFGDVFISAHQARVQAKQLGHSVLEEVLTLVAHGTLHLLGYDDATPRQKAAMFKKQDAAVAAVTGRASNPARTRAAGRAPARR